MDSPFYTLKEIQKMFDVCHITASKIVHSDRFPMFNIGRRIYIPKAEFEQWYKDRLFYPDIERFKSIMKEVHKP